MPTPQHNQTPEDPDIGCIEAALEVTGFAAAVSMAPRDLAILSVGGSTHAGSTIELSAAFQQIADAADGSVRSAAHLIAWVAKERVWYLYMKGLWS